MVHVTHLVQSVYLELARPYLIRVFFSHLYIDQLRDQTKRSSERWWSPQRLRFATRRPDLPGTGPGILESISLLQVSLGFHRMALEPKTPACDIYVVFLIFCPLQLRTHVNWTNNIKMWQVPLSDWRTNKTTDLLKCLVLATNATLATDRTVRMYMQRIYFDLTFLLHHILQHV